MLVSPHVYNIRERIQINGKSISESDFTIYFLQVQQAAKELGQNAGYFESLFAIGLLAAKMNQPDYLIVETGLGGMYDSSNALIQDNKVVILTPIGLDHQKILGDTIEEIAIQKSGIIRNDAIVFVSPQQRQAKRIIEEKVISLDANTIFIDDIGSWRDQNRRLVNAVVEYLANRDRWNIVQNCSQKSYENLIIPGRFERYFLDNNRAIVFDGAHNPQKMVALIENMKTITTDKVDVIFAAKKGKDIESMLRLLLPIASKLYITEFYQSQDSTSQAEQQEPITRLAKELGFESVQYLTTSRIKNVMLDNNLLVTGSFMHLGVVREQFSYLINNDNKKTIKRLGCNN